MLHTTNIAVILSGPNRNNGKYYSISKSEFVRALFV